jgi:MFS family permease
MRQDEAVRQQGHGADLRRALLDWRVWLLSAVYFTPAVGTNAAGASFPKLISEQFKGSSPLAVGLLTSLPYLSAVAAMILLGLHSDRTGERRGHVAFAALVGAAGWFVTAVAGSPGMTLLGLCIAAAGMMAILPCFWAMPTAFLGGAAAAGGIALINSIGNIGGAVGARLHGWLGPNAMGIVMCAGSVLALFVRHHPRGQDHPPAP